MSTITIGDGSSSVPPLQRVEKGPRIVPELTKVGEDTKSAENAPMGSKTDPIPPLTPVSKSQTPEIPPLTKVGPVGPPPLTKVDPKPVEAPPLTLVKTAAPVNAPELKVAIKKEFTGLIFEVDDEENVKLSKVFLGNDAKDLANSKDKIEALVKSIVLAEYEKHIINREQSQRGVASPVSIGFSLHSVPTGFQNFCSILAMIHVRVTGSENLPVIDGFSQVASGDMKVHPYIHSSKSIIVISIENGQDLSLSIVPGMVHKRHLEFGGTQLGYAAEFREIENRVLNQKGIV